MTSTTNELRAHNNRSRYEAEHESSDVDGRGAEMDVHRRCGVSVVRERNVGDEETGDRDGFHVVAFGQGHGPCQSTSIIVMMPCSVRTR